MMKLKSYLTVLLTAAATLGIMTVPATAGTIIVDTDQALHFSGPDIGITGLRGSINYTLDPNKPQQFESFSGVVLEVNGEPVPIRINQQRVESGLFHSGQLGPTLSPNGPVFNIQMQIETSINGVIYRGFLGLPISNPTPALVDENGNRLYPFEEIPDITGTIDPNIDLFNFLTPRLFLSPNGAIDPESPDYIGQPTDPDPSRYLFGGGTASHSLRTLIDPNAGVPGFGRVTDLGNGLFQSEHYGELEFTNDTLTQAFSFSLRAPLVFDGLQLRSPLLGVVSPAADPEWILTENFGYVHASPTGSGYDGWIYSERFEWMKFTYDDAGNAFLWAPMVPGWFAVLEDGSLYSFAHSDILTPITLESYSSRIYGTVWLGDYNGWIWSDRYGWVWSAPRGEGGGGWFWSEALQEWFGITPEGGIWSAREQRFL